MNNIVTFLGPQDLVWPLGVQDTTPQYFLGTGSYQRTLKVDPYPAYPHDLEHVERTLGHCMDVFPLKVAKFGLWVLSHDLIDRVNGVTFEDALYEREDGSDWEETIPHYDGSGEMRTFRGQALSIALAAKRIPIHPAMTRYLVSHEYGHAAFYVVARTLGYKDSERDKLEENYMELRGIEDYAKKYRGGDWHRNPGEIIANDFRILFTKQEMEYYPHDCPLPSWGDKPLAGWWISALRACQLDERAANIESFVYGKTKN